MSFDRLPDRMLGYATFELAELLAKLTARQRAAIDRIVEHVYIHNRPWAALFREQPATPPSRDTRTGATLPGRPAIPPICPESSYYRKGKVTAEGNVKGEGWGHNKEFQEALKKAVELALATKERERAERLRRAKEYAEENARAAVETWVEVMENDRVGFARIEAAKALLELAFRGEGVENQSSGRALEHDWWAAADGGND